MRALIVSVCLAVLALISVSALASDDAAPDDFRAGTDALSEGRFDDAINHFEAYADRQPSHPDASFNRGLAYMMRIRADAERPGDLGRAAAGFAEALAMRPADGDGRHALQLVQGEVARRRSRRGKDDVLARPTLDRVIVGLVSERGWGIAAVIASLLLALALVLRKRPAGPTHLAGTLLAPASALALLALMPLYLGARQLRLESRPGVLVVREAHLSDDDGVARQSEVVPEAALLEVGERRGRLVHVRYGALEGWVSAPAVRVLRTR